MPNTPFERQHPQSLRPPRYDRLAELAAFHLGFSPYQLWYEFTALQHDEPDPDCRRWLEELPVMLAKQLSPYASERYVVDLKEVLGLFTDYQTSLSEGASCAESVEIEDPEVAQTHIREEMEQILGQRESQPGSKAHDVGPGKITSGKTDKESEQKQLESEISAEDEKAASPEDDLGSDVSRARTDRGGYLYWQRLFGTANAHGHALIRLAAAIGQTLPPHLGRWFRLGQTIGRCLSYFAEKHSDPQVNLRQEILIAASGTDFQGDALVPDISVLAYEQAGAGDLASGSADYFDWGYQVLGRIVAEVDTYLLDEPDITLHVEHHSLWFLGTYVPLTQTECAVLSVIAENKDEVIPRWLILHKALANPEISEDSSIDKLRKADQYVLQVLDKIVAQLKQSDTPSRRDF